MARVKEQVRSNNENLNNALKNFKVVFSNILFLK
jgi:ribosomal protein S21